jgi:predicted Rossmann fold nucleotide-binding protein DprA/Smf involved in DNA uptake
VLELYDMLSPPPRAPSLGLAAEALLDRLRDRAQTADELVRASGVDAGEGAAALTALELAGQVTVEDGVYRAAV